MKKEDIFRLLRQQRVLPLYYHDSGEVSIEILRTLYQAGIRTVEYTNRGEAALENFRLMRQVVDAELPDFKLGIGTIRTVADADKFLSAGADYFISPGFLPGLSSWANSQDQVWIPGCMTPSELMMAENDSFRMVKIFPGDLLGPSFLKSVRPLFPKMEFVITGGVLPEKENVRSWFDAGASCVGIGSKLFTKDIITDFNPGKLREAVARLIHLVSL